MLRPFGDLVAIGQPGEGLTKPGAARIYASDEEWKDAVKRQMQAAQLVVIRAGAGENILWELKKAVETGPPREGREVRVGYCDATCEGRAADTRRALNVSSHRKPIFQVPLARREGPESDTCGAANQAR